jgi:hypothetical protein
MGKRPSIQTHLMIEEINNTIKNQPHGTNSKQVTPKLAK